MSALLSFSRLLPVSDLSHLRLDEPLKILVGQADQLGVRAGVEGDLVVFGQRFET